MPSASSYTLWVDYGPRPRFCSWEATSSHMIAVGTQPRSLQHLPNQVASESSDRQARTRPDKVSFRASDHGTSSLGDANGRVAVPKRSSRGEYDRGRHKACIAGVRVRAATGYGERALDPISERALA